MKKILIIFSFILACAPKPEDRPDTGARFDFGPQLQDVELDLSQLKAQTQLQSSSWPKPKSLDAHQKLELVENLYSLGKQTNRQQLMASSLAGVRKFREQYQVQNVSFEQSPFLDAVVEFTQADAIQQIQLAEKSLRSDSQKVVSFLEKSVPSYPWPKISTRGEQVLVEIDKYIHWFLRSLSSLNLDPAVIEAIQTDVPKKAEVEFGKISAELAQIRNSSTALQAIDAVANLIQVAEAQLSDVTWSRLQQGRQLSERVQSISDAQDVLTVLVQIHRMLDLETSRKTIGQEAPDLFEFMTSVSDTEGRLKCLESRNYSDCPYDGIGHMGKKFKILPEINRKGVGNLKNKIDQAIRDYVGAAVDEEIALAAPRVARTLAQGIQSAAEEKIAELRPIKDDFRKFAKDLAEPWAQRKLPSLKGKIRGLETDGNSGAELIGHGLFVKTQFLNEMSSELHNEERLEWSLEHINKLLALGDSVTQAIDVKAGKNKLSLEEKLDSKFSFAVPDRISLLSAYVAKDIAPSNVDVSVIGQARLLKGLSESIKFLSDWESSSFDTILGQETLAQVYDKAPAEVAQKKLFPKETLIALPVGNAAVILKNLLKELSPVFVLTEENRIIWANKYESLETSPSAMAGVVNLVSGQRDIKVSAQDVAEYITALVEFHQATEKISETKSEKLPIKELQEARSQIRMLVIGLANFLSHKMRSADGWVYDTFLVKEGRIEKPAVQMMTQFRAMAAMHKAYQLTGLAPYSWTVQDLYFKLNRDGFDGKKAFYKSIDSLTEGVEVLNVLKNIEPLLSGKSRNQLDQLLEAWLALLEHRFSKN